MALTDERQDHGHDLPRADDAPGLEPPGIAVQHLRDNARKGKDKSPLFAWMRRHPVIAAMAAVILLAVVAAGIVWWLNARNYVSTDDAFIETRPVQIAPQVSGTVIAVPVTDNQQVENGALLLRIDPRDYEAAVHQARAQVGQAQASVQTVDAQIAAQEANIAQAKTAVTQAQAALTFAQQQYDRAIQLFKSGAGTRQQADQTSSDLTQKKAAFLAAQASETAAEKQLGVLRAQRTSAQAQVDAAKAALNTAQINLDRTTIAAPQAGRIANLTAGFGTYAQPGQAVMTLFKGHVDSIQAGSGTAFSLLPPQNATGNFVKIVQRVPIKIVFDGDPGVYLGPGMSVVPTVKIR